MGPSRRAPVTKTTPTISTTTQIAISKPIKKRSQGTLRERARDHAGHYIKLWDCKSCKCMLLFPSDINALGPFINSTFSCSARSQSKTYQEAHAAERAGEWPTGARWTIYPSLSSVRPSIGRNTTITSSDLASPILLHDISCENRWRDPLKSILSATGNGFRELLTTGRHCPVVSRRATTSIFLRNSESSAPNSSTAKRQH